MSPAERRAPHEGTRPEVTPRRHKTYALSMATGEAVPPTDSGIEIEAATFAEDLEGFRSGARARRARRLPYTRGVSGDMYRGGWTMRQYAGSGPPRRPRTFQVPARGRPAGLSCAFDLPTQMGYRTPTTACRGRGRQVGVAHRLDRRHAQPLAGLPPRQPCPPRMNDQRHGGGPAAALRARGRRAGCRYRPVHQCTIQNDILQEYVARGTYIYRPAFHAPGDRHLRLCAKRIPGWNTDLDLRYHIREAGSTAVQELALRSANGMATCKPRWCGH